MGVLLRKGEALQTLKDARVVAVDKTGTLTRGRPELTDLVLAPGFEGERSRVLALVAAVAVVLPHARDLNVLLTGETRARALGVPVARVRALIYVVASLCTAVAVTIAGSVAFVGLLVPHMVRLAWTRDVRIHLPATAMAGGGLLMLADLIARTLIAPTQLPVGVITTLLGVPTFLYLLMRSAR